MRDVPLTLINVSTGTFLTLSWIIWVAALVTVIGGLVLGLTRFGRHTYIIGSNAEAARRAGINVDRHLLKLYALSGLLAGLAGMLSLTRFATTTIAGHSTDALQVITGVVLGGTSLFGGIGTIIGTVVGMFIPTVLQQRLHRHQRRAVLAGGRDRLHLDRGRLHRPAQAPLPRAGLSRGGSVVKRVLGVAARGRGAAHRRLRRRRR